MEGSRPVARYSTDASCRACAASRCAYSVKRSRAAGRGATALVSTPATKPEKASSESEEMLKRSSPSRPSTRPNEPWASSSAEANRMRAESTVAIPSASAASRRMRSARCPSTELPCRSAITRTTIVSISLPRPSACSVPVNEVVAGARVVMASRSNASKTASTL